MTDILSSSVLLISEKIEDRMLLRAQLDLMGLWGRVVEAETFATALQLTSSQKPELCVWNISDNQYNHEVFLESKQQLGGHIIIIGDQQHTSVFSNECFLSLPHSFSDLQDQIRATILPRHVSDALSRGSELANGDQERIYRDLFDRGSDANLLLDSETHIIIDANQRALDMYGVTREEIIGMNMLELIADLEHIDVWRDTQFLQNSQGKPVFVERLDKKKNGKLMHVTVSGSLFKFAGRMIFQDIIRDETDRKLAEEQRIELRLEQERVKNLRQFINNATHDLMTPLSIIKASSYIVSKSHDEAKRKQKMGLIDSQIERLQGMIEDMMTIAKVGATTPEQLVIEKTDINAMIQTQLENFQPILQKYERTITTHLLPSSTYLSIDAEFIQIAIAKLLENAIYYTDVGGRIDISVDVDDDFFYLSVTDDGTGIAEDEHHHIFKHFYRVEESRPSDSGSGLGLTIAKSIIELHHGRIEVISEKGVGSTFKVFLPKLNRT